MPRQVLITLLLAAAIFLPWLGHGGLSMSEGHRAIPAWEMLDRLAAGESPRTALLVTTMFEQVYQRKPPGMVWAIAASSSLFGPTELAARLVSALATTVGALVSLWFARRHFGPRWAIGAPVAHLLTPLFWQPRSAEIEALNNLCTQACALLAMHIILTRPSAWAMRALAVLAGAAMWAVKGPAGLPVVVAAVACGWWFARARPRIMDLVLPLALPAALFAGLAWAISAATGDRPSVKQDPSEFLFDRSRLVAIATLVPAGLISALPLSLAVFFPWGPDADREAGATDEAWHATRVARALAASVGLSLVLFMVVGVSNPRYTMPAFSLAPPLAAYMGWGLAGFLPHRARLARIGFLGHPLALAGVLTVGAGVFLPMWERARAKSSGRDAGIALGQVMPANATIVADGLVEARPEVLWYAQHSGQSLRPVWQPKLLKPPGLAGRLFVASRTDNHEDNQVSDRWSLGRPIHAGKVAQFGFVVRPLRDEPAAKTPDVGH